MNFLAGMALGASIAIALYWAHHFLVNDLKSTLAEKVVKALFGMAHRAWALASAADQALIEYRAGMKQQAKEEHQPQFAKEAKAA